MRRPAPGAPATELAHLIGFSNENADVCSARFRSRAHCGTKIGKKAYFCLTLSQADARTVGQTSRFSIFLHENNTAMPQNAKKAYFCSRVFQARVFQLEQI
jgi:hypothetical protein